MTASRPEDPLLRQAISDLQAGRNVEGHSRYLFNLYFSWVRGFFGQRGYGQEESEDLAQETLRQVFDQIRTFRRDSPFNAWLFAVASNAHRNEQRRRHREKRFAPEVALELVVGAGARELEAEEMSPPRAAFENERRQALARVVRGLPPQMRQVLALRVDQDLKYREIAEILQISIETVKAHLFQARQRLHAELGEDFGEWRD